MKIAITGHTSGIGKAISDAMITENEILGFSKSNGFDISIESDIKNLVLMAKSCNVFINNAYHETGQVDLFNSMFRLWQDRPNTIVNIISRAKYFDVENAYTQSKKDLYDKSINACFLNKQCRVININLGYVDTDRVKDISAPKLKLNEVAEMIKWTIDQPHHIEIAELSVWSKYGI